MFLLLFPIFWLSYKLCELSVNLLSQGFPPVHYQMVPLFCLQSLLFCIIDTYIAYFPFCFSVNWCNKVLLGPHAHNHTSLLSSFYKAARKIFHIKSYQLLFTSKHSRFSMIHNTQFLGQVQNNFMIGLLPKVSKPTSYSPQQMSYDLNT